MRKCPRQLVGRNGGFIILGTVVVVAILLILYMMQVSTFFQGSIPGGSDRRREKPWHVEDRILGKETLIKMPKPPKPEIDDAFVLDADVTRQGDSRGTMRLDFADNGEVSGVWTCGYSHEDRHYTYEASFAGNIDVGVTFSDRDGDDKSQLYFIAKGSYAKGTYTESTGTRSTEKGTVYVTGFLKGDYSASGLLTITTDREWFADYEWESEAGEDKS